MKIIINVSDEVIKKFCEDNGEEYGDVVKGINDWFNYYEDEEFFVEELKYNIFNV